MTKLLNIMGITYTITEYPFTDNDNAMGRWIEAKTEILIKKNMPDDMQELTTWHEVTHAILKGIGETKLCDDEDFVEKLSRALYQTANLKYIDYAQCSPIKDEL